MKKFGNVTYAQIIEALTAWISTNCVNITNFAGMHANVKNGTTYTAAQAGVANYVEYLYCDIVSAIEESTITAVETDISTFLTSIGLSENLDQEINFENFYSFVNNIVAFCCAKLGYISNRTDLAATSFVKYLIYNSNPISNTTPSNLGQDTFLLITKTTTIDSFLELLLPHITSSLRTRICYNTFRLS